MIAVIGGTGAEGKGLVARWAASGEDVIIGSRQREKGEKVAGEISEKVGKEVRGDTNLEAARAGDVVVLSVPFDGMDAIIEQIKPGLTSGKVLITAVVPMKWGDEIVFEPPECGSASEEVVRLVPEGVRVVAAFQTVGAKRLRDPEEPLNSDIPVCGDDEDAKRTVMDLISKMPGARAVDAGPLANSRYVEALTVLLVDLTRKNKVPDVGLKFSGI